MKPTRVIVSWDDACVHEGQYTVESARKLDIRPRQTIGWLVHINRKNVWVATEYDPPVPMDAEGFGYVTVIPRSLVTNIEQLKG